MCVCVCGVTKPPEKLARQARGITSKALKMGTSDPLCRRGALSTIKPVITVDAAPNKGKRDENAPA